jgi:hypothetical protein
MRSANIPCHRQPTAVCIVAQKLILNVLGNIGDLTSCVTIMNVLSIVAQEWRRQKDHEDTIDK